MELETRGSEAGRVIRAVKVLDRRRAHSKSTPNQLKHLKTRIFALTLTQTLSTPIQSVQKWAFSNLQSGLLTPFPPLLKPIFNVINRKRVADSIAVKHTAISLARVSYTAKNRLVDAGFCAIRLKSCLNRAFSILETRVKAAIAAYNMHTLRQGMVHWQIALLGKTRHKIAIERADFYRFSAFLLLFARVQMRQLQGCWEKLRKAVHKDSAEAGKRLFGRVKRLFERRISRYFSTLQQGKSSNKDNKATFLRFTQICQYKQLDQLIYAFSSLRSPAEPVDSSAKRSVTSLFRGVLGRLVYERLRLALRNVRIWGIRQVRKAAKLQLMYVRERKRAKKKVLKQWKRGIMQKRGILRLLIGIKAVKISNLSSGWSKIKAISREKSRIKRAFDQIESISGSKQYKSLINLQIQPQLKRKSDWERTCRRRVVEMIGILARNWQKERIRKKWE